MLALYVMTNRFGTITRMLQVCREETQVTLQTRNGKKYNKIDEGQQQKLTQYLIDGFTYLVRKLNGSQIFYPNKGEAFICIVRIRGALYRTVECKI